MDKLPLYRKIFFSTTKYLFLKNLFLFATGILSIFIVRFLGPAEYGKYFLVVQIASTIGPIISLGWLPTLAKNIPGFTGESEKKELFSNAMATVIIAIAFFSALFLIFGNAFDRFVPKEIRDVKYIFLFLICITALINAGEGMYRGLGRFNGWALADGIRGVVASLLILYLLIELKQGYRGAVNGTFLTSALFVLVIGFMTSGHIKSPDFRIKPEILKFILIMFVGQILFLFTSTVDPVLLRWLLKDPAQVGYYSAGARIPKLAETLFLGHLAVPFLYYFTVTETVEQRKRIIENVTRLLGVVFGFTSLFLFSFSGEIISLLFSRVFGDSIIVMRVYAFWIFFVSLQVFVSPFFLAINKPFVPFLAGLFFFIFNFYFDLIFIPKFFAAGAALGAIFAVLTQTFLYMYLFEKYNVNLSKDIFYLIIGVALSLFVGVLTAYPVSLIVFPVFIALARLITINDFNNFKTIFFKKEAVAL